jgi:hypothetical protein
VKQHIGRAPTQPAGPTAVCDRSSWLGIYGSTTEPQRGSQRGSDDDTKHRVGGRLLEPRQIEPAVAAVTGAVLHLQLRCAYVSTERSSRHHSEWVETPRLSHDQHCYCVFSQARQPHPHP